MPGVETVAAVRPNTVSRFLKPLNALFSLPLPTTIMIASYVI